MMKPNKICSLLIATIIFGVTARADDIEKARSFFSKGNTSYSEEKFEKAIANYEEALNLGLESGPLYYNLGNAYFKHGDLGKAILNYLRAKRLIPEDADLQANLSYAQSLIKNRVAPPKISWFKNMFLKLANLFNIDKAAISAAVFYFIFSILIALALLFKKQRRIFIKSALIISAIVIICSSIFYAKYEEAIVKTKAVIIAEGTDCKFEPFISATTFFTLTEGEDVTVIASKKDWVKIRRTDGKQGWISAQYTKKL